MAPLAFTVRATEHRDAIEIAAECDRFDSEYDYSWRLRLTVRHGEETRRFLAGDDSDQNHESMVDYPPSIDLPWLHVRFPLDVTIELRVRQGKRGRTFAGSATIPGSGTHRLEVASAGRLGGPGFDGGETIERSYASTDHRLREVTVPDVGLLAYEDKGGDFDARGTPLWLYDGTGARVQLFVPGNTITPPGATFPQDWRHFDRLLGGPSSWVLLRRSRRNPSEDTFAALRLPTNRPVDVFENHLHLALDLGGTTAWFTIDGTMHCLDLETGERGRVERRFPYDRGSVYVAGPLLCVIEDDRLEITHWQSGRLVEEHDLPRYAGRPLVHPAARRVAWLVRLGTVQGPLSVVRWHDLDSGAGGETAVADQLHDATLLADGRIVASGKLATWLLDEASARRLGPPSHGAPIVTADGRWHHYTRESRTIVAL